MNSSTEQSKPLTRIWDRDLNLIYEGIGDPGEVMGDLLVTVDESPSEPNWRTRKSSRIESVTLASPIKTRTDGK